MRQDVEQGENTTAESIMFLYREVAVSVVSLTTPTYQHLNKQSLCVHFVYLKLNNAKKKKIFHIQHF